MSSIGGMLQVDDVPVVQPVVLYQRVPSAERKPRIVRTDRHGAVARHRRHRRNSQQRQDIDGLGENPVHSFYHRLMLGIVDNRQPTALSALGDCHGAKVRASTPLTPAPHPVSSFLLLAVLALLFLATRVDGAGLLTTVASGSRNTTGNSRASFRWPMAAQQRSFRQCRLSGSSASCRRCTEAFRPPFVPR